jgi:hypothetical protein
MGKTFKDRKDYPKYRKAKRTPLKTEYVAFMQNGPTDHFDYDVDEDEFLKNEGERCSYCGKLTRFERGFLQCDECGWVECREAILIAEAA